MKPPKLDETKLLKDLEKYSKLGKVALLLDDMDESDRALLESALRDVSIPHKRLSKALKNQKFDVGPTPIRTWRRANGVILSDELDNSSSTRDG